jgi:AraC-like DNA-binding protein
MSPPSGVTPCFLMRASIWCGMANSCRLSDRTPGRSRSHVSRRSWASAFDQAAPGFLGVAASDLLDRSVPLTDVWARGADELAERLAAVPLAAAAGLLEESLLHRVGAAQACDPLVIHLLRELGQRHGHTPNVTSLARRFDVSERTLRRRCAAAIGYGPKTLARILRFRRALRLILQKQPLVATAQLAGYVDQAHLTHEFHCLAGAAPGTLYDPPRLVISANGCPI